MRNVGTDYAWDPKRYNLSGHTAYHNTAANSYTLANSTNATQEQAIKNVAGSTTFWMGMINGEDNRVYYDVKYNTAQGNGSVSTSLLDRF